jgi:tetratricopeptide (TPR) repeat protein
MTEAEQQVFMKLSVFRGGFTREAAQTMTGVALPTLMSLINKSLLRRDASSGRYDIHELLRQYGEQRLDLSPELNQQAHTAHADYFADLLYQRWPLLKGRRQLETLDEIEAESDNIRTAWHTLVSQRKIVEIAGAASSIWWVYGLVHPRYQEAFDLFEAAIAMLRQLPETTDTRNFLGHLMARQSWMIGYLGSPTRGEALAREAVNLIDPERFPEHSALAYGCILLNHMYQYEPQKAAEAGQTGLKIARESGNLWVMALFSAPLGLVALFQGNMEEARRFAEDTIRICAELGDTVVATLAVAYVLAGVAQATGDYNRARHLYEQGLQYFKQVGVPFEIGNLYDRLGTLAMIQHQFSEARRFYLKRLKVFTEIGQIQEELYCLAFLANLMMQTGQKEQALEYASLIIHHSAHYPRPAGWTEAIRTQMQSELSESAYQAACERGKSLDLDTVVEKLLKELTVAE